MSLASLIKARKVQAAQPEKLSLVSRIEEYLTLRPGDDRRDGRFHPSDLSYRFCPRAWALYNWHPHGLTVKEGGFPPKIKRVFDNGHGLHDRIQRYFQMQGILWGRYRRPHDYGTEGEVRYEEHVGFPPRTATGEIDPSWKYAEVKLRHDPDNILGSTDGIMRLKGHSTHGFEYGKWVLEIKSINSRGFGWLPESHTPEGEKEFHRSQGLIYEHCLEYERELAEDGMWAGAEGWDFWMQPLDGVVFLYECKDTQDLREFVMPFKRDDIASFLATVRDRMNLGLAYKAAVDAREESRWPVCHCEPGKKEALCKKYPLG